MVLNPHAGRGVALRAWPRLERELQARGLRFDLILATTPEDALLRVARLPFCQSVLAVGGDGTVRALLPALVGTGRALGIVPLGSGNDFAGMLGLRSGNFRQALDRLAAAPRAVDALWVDAGQGRTFVLNGFGMGFDALVASLMLQTPARLNGFSRYAWGALRGVRSLYHHQVEVTLDSALMYRGPSPLVAVMNGTRYGGGFQISPESDARDGRLDVVLASRLSRGQLTLLMGSVLRGAHLDDPRVRCGRGREVRVSWSVPTHLHLDGDVGGEVSSVSAGVQPGAVLLY